MEGANHQQISWHLLHLLQGHPLAVDIDLAFRHKAQARDRQA